MRADYNNYKFRCSALGNIVTKSGTLTDAAKTYLTDCFIADVEGVRKEAYGKALDKGIACEQDGLDMLNQVFYKDQFITSIKEPSSNKWINGTADVIVGDTVTDVKNAYDRYTFAKAENSWLYDWQLRGYMFLYKLPKGRLFYCLNNLPEYMIADEERKMFYFQRKWATMDDPDYEKACEDLRKAHNYDNKPIWEKFKFWDIDRNEDDESRIVFAVQQGRDFMNKLLDDRNVLHAINRKTIEK